MSSIAPLKKCTKCGNELPKTQEYFYKHSRYTDGFHGWCKSCHKENHRTIHGFYENQTAKKKRESENTKHCNQCGLEFPRTSEYFPPQLGMIDGLRNTCRDCRRESERQKNGYYNREQRAFKTALEGGVRICTKCKRELPATLEFFHKSKQNSIGLHAHCKDCRNIEKREYNSVNSDKVRHQKRLSHIRNREKNNKRTQKWYHQNLDDNRSKSRSNYHKNKQPYFDRANQRIHQKRSNGGYFTQVEINELYEEQAGMCFYCFEPLGQDFHRDHHIPISRGGTNWIENIVLACEPCNLSKGDKLPTEWKGRFQAA